MHNASIDKRTKRIRLIVFTALTTALTTVLTIVSLPYPTGAGYYNFGDIPIFMSACLLGPVPALITGALGAMLGDVILGYGLYAPFTLVIKALEGVIAGLLFAVVKKFVKKQIPQSILYCLGNIVGGLVMALGYFIAEGVLLAEDRWTGGVINLPFNILQGVISAIVATVLLYVCQLKKVFEKIYNRNPQINAEQSDDLADNCQSNDDDLTSENKTFDSTSQDDKDSENTNNLKF